MEEQEERQARQPQVVLENRPGCSRDAAGMEQLAARRRNKESKVARELTAAQAGREVREDVARRAEKALQNKGVENGEHRRDGRAAHEGRAQRGCE